MKLVDDHIYHYDSIYKCHIDQMILGNEPIDLYWKLNCWNLETQSLYHIDMDK